MVFRQSPGLEGRAACCIRLLLSALSLLTCIVCALPSKHENILLILIRAQYCSRLLLFMGLINKVKGKSGGF